MGVRFGMAIVSTDIKAYIKQVQQLDDAGVAMIGWTHQQLTGQVPAELQVKDPKVATTLNIGGPICSTVVTVQKPAA